MTASISGTGKLRIEADVPCKVFLDGKPLVSLEKGDVETVELLPDSYDLEAERDIGSHWEQTVRVQTETQTSVTIPTTDLRSSSFSEESAPTIIRPGGRESNTGSDKQGSKRAFWVGLLALTVGLGVYGLRPQWANVVVDRAREIVGTSRTSDLIVTQEDTATDIQLTSSTDAALSVSLLNPPAHGSLSFSADSGAVTYRPDPDFTGRDSFRYTLSYSGRTDSIRTDVRVEAVLDAPQAETDQAQTSAGETVTIDLLSNDTSPDSLPLHLEDIVSASGSKLSMSSDSTQVTYTPADGFTGTDTLRYTVADARGKTDGASAYVRVEPPAPTPSDLDMQWTRISEGSFVMGSDRGSADARPSHRVEITIPFRMSAHEVTVRQFRMFVEATGYETDAERLDGAWRASSRDSLRTPGLTWRNPGFEQSDDHPVVNVSWNDAQAFAKWMGGRLPTEAEWAYAARAGETAAKLSGDWEETTWYAENSSGGTHPVGQKAPNEWGLHDVQGNVWEWTQDWYSPEYYKRSSEENPQGPSSGELRVCRGGSWYNDACWLPTRNRASPTYRANNIGFRVVRPINDGPQADLRNSSRDSSVRSTSFGVALPAARGFSGIRGVAALPPS